MTLNGVGILSISEKEERANVVGFCESCDAWYKFTYSYDDQTKHNCPDCGNKPSAKNGFQITTQRTFNPKAKKLSKAQLKKMSLGA